MAEKPVYLLLFLMPNTRLQLGTLASYSTYIYFISYSIHFIAPNLRSSSQLFPFVLRNWYIFLSICS